jgi:hypothetical protein
MDAGMQERAKFADMACNVARRENRDGGLCVSGHAASHDKQNVSGPEVFGGGEGAGAEKLIAQAVTGPQIMGLPVDGDFQLALDEEQNFRSKAALPR